MFAVKHSPVGEHSANGVSGLRSFHDPVKRLIAIEVDGGRIGVGIIGAKFLDETTIARGTSIGHNNVELSGFLATPAGEADFNCHKPDWLSDATRASD